MHTTLAVDDSTSTRRMARFTPKDAGWPIEAFDPARRAEAVARHVR